MHLEGLFCPLVWLPSGWTTNVWLGFDTSGFISDVELDAEPGSWSQARGPVIPGMPNVHSHAFQRAMAGLTQHVGASKDSFWTWRKAMYRFVERMTPETVQACAAQLYLDMLKNGYTAVGEFHYLHHDPNGAAYQQRSELSHRVISAAKEVGIGITHLPVLYAYSGFGEALPTEGQHRFINSLDSFAEIVSDVATTYAGDPKVHLGIAPHSLRAVSPELLDEAITLIDQIDPAAPVHIHVAEQEKEVADCLAWSGQRPVEWLLNHAPVSDRWCLIHATHMSDTETHTLAASGAVAGLCPTTEADLGDGFFPALDFLNAQGRFAIGSDSHAIISPTEELRWLEYEQRLVRRQRNVLHIHGSPSIGAGLYRKALEGGALAMGRPLGQIAPGYRADLVVLDGTHPLLFDKQGDEILDTYVFSGGKDLVRDVIVGGQHLVQEGHHAQEEEVAERYKAAMAAL